MIVELLSGDGKPGVSGVFPMLDEECNIVGGTPEGWCRKLEKSYGLSALFHMVKRRRERFVIQHFAGPVEYDSEAFLAKNKDTLSSDVVQVMKASANPFVQNRFLDDNERTFGTQTVAATGS